MIIERRFQVTSTLQKWSDLGRARKLLNRNAIVRKGKNWTLSDWIDVAFAAFQSDNTSPHNLTKENISETTPTCLRATQLAHTWPDLAGLPSHVEKERYSAELFSRFSQFFSSVCLYFISWRRPFCLVLDWTGHIKALLLTVHTIKTYKVWQRL